jgi:biotin-dependent carboxylase-like uncharacterized protein
MEMLRATMSFEATSDVDIVVTGAPVEIVVNEREYAMSQPVHVSAGAHVRIRSLGLAMRTYVGVRGGWDVDVVLGSRSYDELTAIGPEPVKSGDILPISRDVESGIRHDASVVVGVALAQDIRLRVHRGPRWDWFDDGILLKNVYRVSSKSNRVGVRLEGPALAWDTARSLPSEGIVTGAVQVPVDGIPLIFGPDHPTTGGYPVIAVVNSLDMNLLAQAPPGTSVRFVPA